MEIEVSSIQGKHEAIIRHVQGVTRTNLGAESAIVKGMMDQIRNENHKAESHKSAKGIRENI